MAYTKSYRYNTVQTGRTEERSPANRHRSVTFDVRVSVWSDTCGVPGLAVGAPPVVRLSGLEALERSGASPPYGGTPYTVTRYAISHVTIKESHRHQLHRAKHLFEAFLPLDVLWSMYHI